MSLPSSLQSRRKAPPKHADTWPRVKSDELGDDEQVQAFVQEMRRSSFLQMLAKWSPCVPTVASKDAAMAKQEIKKTATETENDMPQFMNSPLTGFLSTTNDA